MEDYQYLPIDEARSEIRYFILLPDIFDAPVRGLLVTAPLKKGQIPAYEAISYAWGSQEDPVEMALGTADDKAIDDFLLDHERTIDQESVHPRDRIRLDLSNHDTGFQRLLITQNLNRALPYLRYEREPRVLWIDAICVDQTNLQERSKQVARMADIFISAARVVVWLGEGNESSHLAIDFLESISSSIRMDWKTHEIFPIPGMPLGPKWSDRRDFIEYDEEVFLQLYDLFDSSWFSRLWIWQEIHLGSDASILMLGSQSILWDDFRHAMAVIYIRGYSVSVTKIDRDSEYTHANFHSLRSHVFNITQELQVSNENFQWLTELSRHSKCSEPRDRIFALLSLVHKGDLQLIPDYTKTIESIYRETTEILMRNRNSLEILSRCELRESPLSLPSWVPDFSVPQSSVTIWTSAYPFSTLENGAEIHGDVMKAKGVIIAKTLSTILEVNVTFSMPVTDVGWTLANFISHLDLSTISRYDDPLEAVARTFRVNRFAERWSPPYPGVPSDRTIKSFYEFVWKILDGREEEPSQDFGFFITGARTYLPGRNFFITSDGYIGLCPTVAEESDMIACIVGCRTPLILRPTVQGRYRVVGDAYCHGFMKGEAFLNSLPPNFDAVARLLEEEVAFLDRDTGSLYTEDPRLGELPTGWSRLERERARTYSVFCKDGTTDEYISSDYDPRTTPAELEKRGVKIQDFEFV